MNKNLKAVVAAAAFFTFSSAWCALPKAIDEDAIALAAVQSFPQYLHLLTLPNDSLVSAQHVVLNANFLENMFQQRGFKTKQFSNDGKPLVLAQYPSDKNKKTILFYFHFDGIPVIPAQWHQASPWEPVLKKKDENGKWQVTDIKELMQPHFDPELRIFARSAADDKAPIMMFLAAMDVMRTKQINPAVNIKILLDSQEEISSPGIAQTVEQNRDYLQADALVIFDMAAHPSGRPTAIFGNRGVQTITLTTYGAKSPLHSGHYGNFVPNPALSLAQLLASMKNEEGQVLIKNYYSTTQLNNDDLKVLDALDDDAALMKRVGIAKPDKVASNYQRALQYPSLNIRGLSAGAVGKEAGNIIPKEAIAELDIRTTNEASASYLTQLLKQHIAAQGFHIVANEPTDTERNTYPKLIKVSEGLAEEAARQAINSPIRYWFERAQKSAYEGMPLSEPILIRASGATVPTHQIVTPLGMPFIIVPTVNPDNNQHTYDENLRMGHYLTGMRTMLGLLNMVY